ncbi:MAG: hypothetical protein H8F28_14775 [Fibrella sp.]|nr:hypothetical protein [Armatimonadota bacterium]
MRRFWQIVAITIGAMMIAPGTVQAQAQSVSAAPGMSTPTVEDIALLKKAVDAVQKSPVTLTSDLRVKASGSGVVMLLNETIKVNGQFPGKFRSDVTLLDEDGKTPAATFQVVGDGTNVYTYRSDTKKYAVQTVAAFHKDFAMPVIGVLCGLIASADPWVGEDAPTDANGVMVFLDALKTAGMILESRAGENGRRVFTVRPVSTVGDGFRVQATADARTGSFVTMEMDGKQGDWKFSITETVRSMAKLPSFESAGFTPPADAEKVAKLSVWPF